MDEIIRATTPRFASAALTDDDFDDERYNPSNSASASSRPPRKR